MTITPFQIYLWQQLDQIIDVINGSLIIGIIVTIIGAFLWFMFDHDISESTHASIKKYVFRLHIPLLIFLTISKCLLPSSKTCAMIIAVPAIIDSKPIQKDLPEIYDMAVNALKEQFKTDKKEK